MIADISDVVWFRQLSKEDRDRIERLFYTSMMEDRKLSISRRVEIIDNLKRL